MKKSFSDHTADAIVEISQLFTDLPKIVWLSVLILISVVLIPFKLIPALGVAFYRWMRY